MNFGVLQALWLPSRLDPDRPDFRGGIFRKELLASAPPAEAAQCLEAAIDGGGLELLDLDQVVTVSRELEGREARQRVLGRCLLLEPAKEQSHFGAVGADGSGAQISLGQAGGELAEQSFPGDGGRLETFAQCEPLG